MHESAHNLRKISGDIGFTARSTHEVTRICVFLASALGLILMAETPLDKHDLAILRALQRNAEVSHAELGEVTHLSGSQVSRRIQKLRDAGLVLRNVVLLNPKALGLNVLAFTFVSLERHGRAHGVDFEQQLQDLPQVLECFSVSGEADYILRIVAEDLESFSAFMMSRILSLPGVGIVKSHIALQKVKQTSEFPLRSR
jgi:Lrp/AsnC family transcriptional regulator, leucine-responsive regulatory protein